MGSNQQSTVHFTVAAGAKQTELIALLHRTGQQQGLPSKPFSVGPTGLILVKEDSADSATGSGMPPFAPTDIVPYEYHAIFLTNMCIAAIICLSLCAFTAQTIPCAQCQAMVNACISYMVHY